MDLLPSVSLVLVFIRSDSDQGKHFSHASDRIFDIAEEQRQQSVVFRVPNLKGEKRSLNIFY